MMRFSENYAKTLNAYQSAIDAGYTPLYAKNKSCKLVNHPDVAAEIKKLRKKIVKRVEKSGADVINEFSKIAFTDRVDFLKPDPLRAGEFIYKSPNELTPDQRGIVESISFSSKKFQDAEGADFFRKEYRYTLSDKSSALQQMGRHFGLFDDKLRLTGSSNNPFSNMSQDQLTKLKESFVNIMVVGEGEIIEGNFKEIKHDA